MNTVETKETLTPYEQACEKCIDDLYHTAYLALADADTAEKLVTKICVTGFHKYGNLENEQEIRFLLTSEVYHRTKRRLLFSTPHTDHLPKPLQVLSKQERLLVAIRFSSGLPEPESARIVGLSPEQYRNTISDILRKAPLKI